MEVRELAHRPAVTCVDTTPVKRVAELMKEQGVGSVVVLNNKGMLTGIVTDRDLALRGLGWGHDRAEPVATVMSGGVVHVYETDSIFSAATRMAERGFRRLPVLSGVGRVVGMITLDDLLLFFGEQIGKLTRAVAREIRPAPARTG